MANTTSPAKKVAEGLGVAALAAAAAATYYFTGPDGEKHRKTVSSWATKAKSEMVQKMKHMKTVSEKTYQEASKEILAKYKQAKNIDPKELAALGKELKTTWDKISKEVSKLGAKTAKSKAAPRKIKAKK